MKSMVELSHAFLAGALHRQAVCIDATLGNGQDTAWLLKRHATRVLAFEIQPDVLQETQAKLNTEKLEAFLVSHSCMKDVLNPDLLEHVDAVIFNFGWCPHKDSKICTQADTSLEAVKQALDFLRIKGRMALVFYPHEGWEEEAEVVEAYLSGLDPHVFAIQKTVQFNARQAPFLFCIEKKKSNLT